jgi:hypothetical protein
MIPSQVEEMGRRHLEDAGMQIPPSKLVSGIAIADPSSVRSRSPLAPPYTRI